MPGFSAVQATGVDRGRAACYGIGMELITQLFDLILHVDAHLEALLEACGNWTYAVLVAIVFAETGLVVTPFLPGDSLLFAAGTFAGTGHLSLPVLLVTLTVAAIVGDAVNYAFGRRFGEAVLAREKLFLIRRDHLRMTEEFFARHGGKAVVLARFAPIVRTFAPFVAGAGRMSYSRFAAYNVAGGVAWVGICTAAGYLFGQMPIVRDNFSLVALGIVFVSVLPMGIEILRGWLRSRRAAETGPAAEPAAPATAGSVGSTGV
ncbi:MAG TPA: DedA family protein [Planctomycetaceae bacterium]